MDVIHEFRKRKYKESLKAWNTKQKFEKYALEIRPKERSDIIDKRKDLLRKETGILTTLPTEEEVETLVNTIRDKVEHLRECVACISCSLVQVKVEDGPSEKFKGVLNFLAYPADSEDTLLRSLQLNETFQRLAEVFLYLRHQPADECLGILTPKVVESFYVLVKHLVESLDSSGASFVDSENDAQHKRFFLPELECLIVSILNLFSGNSVLCQIFHKICIFVVFNSFSKVISLRLIQLAFISLSTLFDSSSRTLCCSVDSYNLLNSINKEEFICQLIYIYKGVTLLGDAGCKTLGGPTFLDGFDSFVYALLCVATSLTYDSSSCIYLLEKRFFKLFLEWLPNQVLSFGLATLDSQTTTRMALVDVLVGLTRCLSLLSEKPHCLTHKTQNALLDLAQGNCMSIFWKVAISCFQYIEGDGLTADAEKNKSRSTSNICFMPYYDPSLSERLNAQPCDILLPCLDILNLLILYQVSSWITQEFPQVSSQLILWEKETVEKSFFKPLVYREFPNGLLLRALLSSSIAIKRRGVQLLSSLASGSIDDMEFCLTYFPILLYCLINIYPYFILQDAMLALNRLTMNHDAHFFERILHYDAKCNSDVFVHIAEQVDPYSFHEQASPTMSNKNFTNVSLSDIPLVLSVVLRLLHSEQKDVQLVHMIFDFLEYVMNADPKWKLIIYQHGGVSLVESVQSINDDGVFLRTVDILKKYFDEFDD